MPFGPQYCETPATITGFPAESWNTWSNLVIVAFGLVALGLIGWRARGAHDLWLLGGLLTVNGAGSFAWHGFRTPGFLALDSVPGALFLLCYAYLWMRRFLTPGRAALMFLAFLLLTVVMMAGTAGLRLLPPSFLFVPIAPVAIGFSARLIAQSRRRSVRAAWLGAASITSAVVAVTFRSIDQIVCPYFPIGTHFLWHLFLSLAAFLGILTLLALDAAKPRLARPRGARTPRLPSAQEPSLK